MLQQEVTSQEVQSSCHNYLVYCLPAYCPHSVQPYKVMRCFTILLLFQISWLITGFTSNHQIIKKRRLLYNCEANFGDWRRIFVHSTSPSFSSKKRDHDDLLEQVTAPVFNIFQQLGGEIEPLDLPIIYPLTIILFNLWYSSTTSVIFDVTFVLFYVLVRQLKSLDEDADESDIDEGIATSSILDAVSLFAAGATSILISPNGCEQSDANGAISALPFILSIITIGFVALMGIFDGEKNSSEGYRQDVDPSQRLLELFDEKLKKGE